MDNDTAQTLLESIAADRLVLLIGAGLSMAPPSSLPSAASVARTCAERYEAAIGTPLDATLQTDLGQMSASFITRHSFDSLFIGKLVPWEEFHQQPNAGHEAIADFLACGAIVAGVTTNFDCLVEAAAHNLGEPDFWPIVDQVDIPVVRPHKAYLKAHGCEQKCRLQTVWCRDQLGISPLSERMNHFRDWLATHLLGRDLLVIGFWSDWNYLNELLAENLPAVGPRSVILVDPDAPTMLETKAPVLWQWSHGNNITFSHVRESAAEFLHDLRCRLGQVFLRRLCRDSAPTYEQLFGAQLDLTRVSHDGFAAPALYALRRDLTGVVRNQPVRCRQPQPFDHIAAALHAHLIINGATYEEHSYTMNNRSVRVISTPGVLMSAVKERYLSEPPLQRPVAQTVCAGAVSDPSPAHIIRAAQPPTIVRSGLTGDWVTHESFVQELLLP